MSPTAKTLMNKERWAALMEAMGLPPSLACYQALIDAYSQPHRHYHTTRHISAMLRHFDQARDLLKHPEDVEVAIWFHDAVYKPFSSKNELDSALWAESFLSQAGYHPDGIKRIYKLIMATLHNEEEKSGDERLMVDIDLTILGARPTVYDEFEKNVRREYRLVPSFIYRRQRKQILRMFLDMEAIYGSAFFRELYEQSARENVERAIAAL